jgi:hypothetical protein
MIAGVYAKPSSQPYLSLLESTCVHDHDTTRDQITVGDMNKPPLPPTLDRGPPPLEINGIDKRLFAKGKNICTSFTFWHLAVSTGGAKGIR